MVLKLYKFSGDEKYYWETWDNGDSSHTIHWGELGTRGQSEIIKSSFITKANVKIQKLIDRFKADGYAPFDFKDHRILIIEFATDGAEFDDFLHKRHRLENRMNELLGWTGLGECDGGSFGSGTMEVCNLVVDFEIAKQVIENDLKGTEFENYTRIYDEGA